MKIPMGRRACLATTVDSTLSKAQNGGWTYPGVAQLYKTVNDRNMYFFPNSGAKTIQERVPRKAIKLHNGHPSIFLMQAAVREIVGFVASAEERQSSMRYVGFISSAEEEIADKMTDQTITENSMEVIILAAVDKKVDIDMVPEISRRFVSMDSDGMAVVLGIKEFYWKNLGLVSASSQDTEAILGPPTMVALSGLPVSRAAWEPGAAQQAASQWAGTLSRSGGREVPNLAKLGCAYLAQFCDENGDAVLAGQIAAPDADGNLVVNSAALAPALDDLSRQLARSGLPREAQEQTLNAAFERMKPYMLPSPALTSVATGDISSEGATNRKPDDTGTGTPAAGQLKASDDAADSQEAAGPASPPTVGSEKVDIESATTAHLNLQRRIDGLKVRYPRVAYESAGTSRGPTAGSRPGP